MTTIERKIYYCWFGGEKPTKVLECINNWKEKLPNYEIIEISDKNPDLFDVEQEINNNSWFKTCYENNIWAYVSDYARLKVLYQQGGVYFDTDITVEKDITELLEKEKLVLGWEDKSSTNISAGVIIVNKNNHLIKQMLDFYNDKIWSSKLFTIPHIITYVLKKNYTLQPASQITENEEILILPQEYFYPIPIGKKEKANYVTPNSYTIHWWDGSWLKSNIDYFMRNKHKIPTEKLIKTCFSKKFIVDNPFLKIEKLFNYYNIIIDFYYSFKFRYKYYDLNRYLTVFFFGKQIKLFKVKG